MTAQRKFSPLITNKQKAALCQLARAAYDEAEPNLPLAEWRHQEQLKVTGKASLTKCNQDDYLPLQRHYLAIKNGGSTEAVATPREDWPSGDAPAKLWDKQVGAQIRKIGKCLGSRRSWNYGHALAKRIAKVEHLDWCTSAQLRRIIAALTYDKKRKG